MGQPMPNQAILQGVRFSYANVWQPKTMGDDPNEKPKYSISVLIPKNNQMAIQAYQVAVNAAIQLGQANGKLANVNPNTLKLPLRDGDSDRPDDPAYRGMYFFNASSFNQPGIVDANVQPILNQSDFYSGCWGNVSVVFYPFSGRSKGIAAGLNNIQKTRDDEALAGHSTPQDDFQPVPGAAPAAPTMPGVSVGAPQGYQQPAQGGYQQPAQGYGQPNGQNNGGWSPGGNGYGGGGMLG